MTNETQGADKPVRDSVSGDRRRPRRTEPADASGQGAGAREYSSRDLLGGGREAVIRHGPDAYRLRLTGNGKLLLTK